MYQVWLVILVIGSVLADQNVMVVRMRLDYDQEHRLSVNNTIEYILIFAPSASDAEYPSRVWVNSVGGDLNRPVLITYRQNTGAGTWQLPYQSGDKTQNEFERTLCLVNKNYYNDSPEGQEAQGQFSLHIVSGWSNSVEIRVRVTSARDWFLNFEEVRPVYVTLTAPRVYQYRFREGETSVRLVISSTDDVCATIAVQNVTCPIGESLEDQRVWSQRMTVQRSGGVQLSRTSYPVGFYVIAVVRDSDEACTGVTEEPQDWLWQEILGDLPLESEPMPRVKSLEFEIKPSLTRTQYVLATGLTVALFLGFYVAFILLVLAQRWAPFAKHVSPKAVLAADIPNVGQTEVDGGQRRRRDSTATFDSSDMSDSDDEEQTTVTRTTNASPASPATPASSTTPASPGSPTSPSTPPVFTVSPESRDTVDGPEMNGANTRQTVTGDTNVEPPPFGLPTQLRLAALARRRGRVLRARSDRYLHTLYTVAVFYALPVMQFVAAFQVFLNVSGTLDTCYYNFLCAHPAGALSDFNHVFSNAGYMLLGALFLLQVRRRRKARKLNPRHDDYGIPARDAVILYVRCLVWGVLGGGAAFWGLFTVLHVFGFLLLSLRIYYLGQFRFEKQILQTTAAQTLQQLSKPPLYKPRLVALLIANAVNWLFAIYGLFTQSEDFASHLLTLLLGNTLLQLLYYLAMKLLHGERPRWYSWCYLAGATAAWVPGLYLFTSGSTDWSATPAHSRHLNHECRILSFYDSHDLWHFLSAVALYFTFCVYLTWDDGLSAVKRTDIAVF